MWIGGPWHRRAQVPPRPQLYTGTQWGPSKVPFSSGRAEAAHEAGTTLLPLHKKMWGLQEQQHLVTPLWNCCVHPYSACLSTQGQAKTAV